MADLHQLRRQLRTLRKQLTTKFQHQAAQQVAISICALDIYKKSHNISAYLPINGELDPQPLIAIAWQDNKNVYLPIVDSKQHTLSFVKYTKNTELTTNIYGIKEPAGRDSIAPHNLDLVIVPMVGFDDKCHRLGMGGGYYDRTFAFCQQNKKNHYPYLIGIAYEAQKIPGWQSNPWDIAMNKVITEKNIYN